jgi:rhodanese-related sulfurtransferase
MRSSNARCSIPTKDQKKKNRRGIAPRRLVRRFFRLSPHAIIDHLKRSSTMSKLNLGRPVALAALAVLSILLAAPPIASADETGKTAATTAGSELPERKTTTLGLYVSAAQAYEMWKSAPDKVKVIDVRTPEEYAFVGHPEKAWNIPFAFVTYHRKEGKFEHKPKWNLDFVTEVKSIAEAADILLVMCRSGDRSAMAVNKLAAAGFTNAYTVTDGFEGDKVTDPGSVFVGKRMRNGWKNSAPWVYGIDPEKVILEEGASKQTQ